MPVQPQLFPDPPATPDGKRSPASLAAGGPASPPSLEAPPAPIWLQRLSLFVLVIFCIYLGAIVTVLPWWSSVWDRNLFFLSRPRLWSVLRLGLTRGIISGLGLLDIWIGISEAIHYHDQRR